MLSCLTCEPRRCPVSAGVATLDSEVSGKIGLYAVLYYLSTTVMAVVLGEFLAEATVSLVSVA